MNDDADRFDPAERARQKQASRDRDARRLADGEVTPTELRRENAFFGSLDFSRFRMTAIGDRPVEYSRRSADSEGDAE